MWEEAAVDTATQSKRNTEINDFDKSTRKTVNNDFSKKSTLKNTIYKTENCVNVTHYII